MTTCSSTSDNPDSASDSDVEEDINHSATDELPLGHVQKREEGRNRLKLKTADSQCDGDLTDSYTCLSDTRQQIMEAEAGCNGILTEVDIQSEQARSTCSTSPEISNNELHNSITVCLANGSVSEIPVVSTMSCVTSSEEQLSSFAVRSEESKVGLPADTLDSKPASDAHCMNRTANTELRPSLANSIPLLSIPQADHSRADDESFSLLPPSSPSTVHVTPPPSVFSVPCTGKESDVFTDVNLDDSMELPRSVHTLAVPAAGSTGSSRDSSPSRLQLATSSSSLHLDDAIVQSVLCDDDDDNDASHTVGSSRHSTSIAFATNTYSAAFRTPGCAAASAVPVDKDGLHVVEPDSVSFEEISLHSYSAPATESRTVAPEQPATSASKRNSLANFFARSL